MNTLITSEKKLIRSSYMILVWKYVKAGKSHASAHKLVGEKVDEQRMQKSITYPDCKGLAAVSQEHWSYYTGNQLGILK